MWLGSSPWVSLRLWVWGQEWLGTGSPSPKLSSVLTLPVPGFPEKAWEAAGTGVAERPPALSPGPRGKEPPSGTGCRKGDSRAEGGQVDGSHCRCFGTGSEVVVWLSAFPLQRLAFTRYVYGLLT